MRDEPAREEKPFLSQRFLNPRGPNLPRHDQPLRYAEDILFRKPQQTHRRWNKEIKQSDHIPTSTGLASGRVKRLDSKNKEYQEDTKPQQQKNAFSRTDRSVTKKVHIK